jgi:hypothetical protein
MSKVAEYQELRKIADEAIEKAGVIFKDAIVEAIGPVFDKYENVKSVAVWAYTPSFADGDIPSFTLNIEDAEINDTDIYDDDFEDSQEISYEDARLIQKDVYEALGSFDKDDWERSFNSYGFKAVFSKDKDGLISLTEEDYDCGY